VFIEQISLQPNGVNDWFFKLRLFDQTKFELSKIDDENRLQRYRDYKVRIYIVYF